MGGKQDLLFNIMRDVMQAMVDGARAAVRGHRDPPAQLAALARFHVVFNGRNVLDAYVGDGEIRSLDSANRSRIVALRDAYEAEWAKVIDAGVERGDFMVGDRDLFRLAVIQMVNSVAVWYSPAGRRPLDAIADEFAAFALAMAGSGPGPIPAEAAASGGGRAE
jgi:TetR/AcrR family transcriptional regulator, cholesterol catabolism regulator